MRTRAAILVRPGEPFRVEELELADPGEREVRVRITASGVCHSDYHLFTGETEHPLPCVAGHEGAGVVEAVGEGVTRVSVGDPVVLSWAPDCGTCFYCTRGRPNLCETFTAALWAGGLRDGQPRLSWRGQPVFHYCGLATFAEHAVVLEESCVPIPEGVPPRVAALVGCAVATGVGAVTHTARVAAGESVVVIGAGGVGLNVIQGAASAGAEAIIAVDTNPSKLELARRFGATQIIENGPGVDAPGAVKALTDGRGADHAFEVVGLPELQTLGLEAIRPGGSLTLVGLAPMGSTTNLPGATIARQEKVVRGSYYGTVDPRRDFPALIDLYREGRLQLDALVSREYRLEEINEAFEAMIRGEVARGVIVF